METKCRQPSALDWAIQILVSGVKLGLERIAQAEQQKPVDERDWRIQKLSELGVPLCDLVTYAINKDLCNPIA